jgi:hypothetical protein
MASNPFSDVNPYQSPTEIVRAELAYPENRASMFWPFIYTSTACCILGFAAVFVVGFLNGDNELDLTWGYVVTGGGAFVGVVGSFFRLIRGGLVPVKSNKATVREAWPVLVVAFLAAGFSAWLTYVAVFR